MVKKHTIESKQKMSSALKRQWDLGLRKGHSFDKETRQKMSISRKLFFKNGGIHARGMFGKKATLETRLKMSKAHKGDRHWNWQGGITPIKKGIRRTFMQTIEYKLWKRTVLERDKKCIQCGSETNLHVDHIKPYKLYPELRLSLDNGRVLCKDCHYKTNTYGSKVLNYV